MHVFQLILSLQYLGAMPLNNQPYLGVYRIVDYFLENYFLENLLASYVEDVQCYWNWNFIVKLASILTVMFESGCGGNNTLCRVACFSRRTEQWGRTSAVSHFHLQ